MNTKSLALAIVYASLYSALSIFLAPISYGAVQVRLSGILLGAVPILGLAGVVGQTIGCFIVNSISPLGLLDLVNVIPTFFMAILIWKLKNRSVLVGLGSYAVVTSISISITLYFAFSVPIAFGYVTVLLGQLVSCVFGGYLLFKALNRRRFKSSF